VSVIDPRLARSSSSWSSASGSAPTQALLASMCLLLPLQFLDNNVQLVEARGPELANLSIHAACSSSPRSPSLQVRSPDLLCADVRIPYFDGNSRSIKAAGASLSQFRTPAPASVIPHG